MAEMRSYEAARGLYSFLGFLAWCVIILGGFVAVGGASAMSNFGSMGMGRSGALPGVLVGLGPGLFISFMGFLALAVVQNGRAAVDSAEYGQQMLQVARDQLEVSRQALKASGGEAPKAWSDSLNDWANKTERQSAPGKTTDHLPSFAHQADRPVAEEQSELVEILEYRGQRIEHRDGAFLCQGTPFDTLDDARGHLDKLARFVPEALAIKRESFEHCGRHVFANEEGYFYNGQMFDTRKDAIAHIDRAARNDADNPRDGHSNA